LDEPRLQANQKTLNYRKESSENQKAAMGRCDAQYAAEQAKVEAREPDFHGCKGVANAAI
jgi:hypothetical protein